MLIIGVPMSFAVRPVVSFNFLWTELHQKNYGGFLMWFVLQTLVYAVVASVPFWLGVWLG